MGTVTAPGLGPGGQRTFKFVTVKNVQVLQKKPCDTTRLLSLLVIRAINGHRKVYIAEHFRMSVDLLAQCREL